MHNCNYITVNIHTCLCNHGYVFRCSKHVGMFNTNSLHVHGMHFTVPCVTN